MWSKRKWRHWSIFCQLHKVFWQMFQRLELGCCPAPNCYRRIKKIYVLFFVLFFFVCFVWLYSILMNEKQWCICLKKKIMEKKYGFKWMVLVLFESQLYISSVMSIENKQKKILCMSCLVVIMMSICEMCIQIKNKEKKKNRKEKNP